MCGVLEESSVPGNADDDACAKAFRPPLDAGKKKKIAQVLGPLDQAVQCSGGFGKRDDTCKAWILGRQHLLQVLIQDSLGGAATRLH